MKRMSALLFALLFLLAMLSSAAVGEMEFDDDDFGGADSVVSFDDEDDDSGSDVFFDDEEDGEPVKTMSEDETNAVKDKMSALSGYHMDCPEENGFIYDFLEDGSGVQTMRYTGFEEDITVPDMLGGKPVVAIGSGTFSNQMDIESVVLPDTVELIDNMAFFKCESLKTVNLPEGLVMIGRSCFGGCISLENLEIPESLQIVDEFVFLKCTAMTEISFSENLKEIGPNAFCMCENLKKVTMPKDTAVDDTAFTQCPEDMEIDYLDE